MGGLVITREGTMAADAAEIREHARGERLRLSRQVGVVTTRECQAMLEMVEGLAETLRAVCVVVERGRR